MNRLANESSPYLRQHADNPVDWYPWGSEAFAAAAAQDKPILLSVGYSACHWCHVMAHESFEDVETASLMNQNFINVKVDREERPDVDAIYMEATQAMTGQGGWPMTAFLTTDAKPFFAGTYFPKVSQAGRPGFVELLDAIHETWVNQRPALEKQADEFRNAIEARTQALASGSDIYEHAKPWLEHAVLTLQASYDKEWGGFADAPKFPQTMALEFLLLHGHTDEVVNSLNAMASGGMYDHVGGGFHRYSVDAFWMVPHFEKMLYDQAALARIYLHAYQVTGEAHFAQVATETIEYVRRDLSAPAGGWFSAEDADSEGEEGTFYIWRHDAVPDEAHEWYGITKAGNFEGANILHRPKRGDLIRPKEIESIRQQLFEERSLRVRPGLDDKVLTEWNAMFIATLAEAGAALGQKQWIDDAERAAYFLVDALHRTDGRWLRSWQAEAGAQHLAYANDYAWLTDAFTRLAEATGRIVWQQLAETTADALIELFWDDDQGGVFTNGSDAEKLIVRNKDLFDGATASANSTAALALTRLAALTEKTDYEQRAEEIIRLIAEPLSHHPTAFANMLLTLDLLRHGASKTTVGADVNQLVAELHATYLPRNVLAWGEGHETESSAMVCKKQTCGPKTAGLEHLLEQLRQ